MFVFKAAVMGEGSSSEEIARVIEAAGVTVTRLASIPEPSPIGDVEFVIASGLDELEAAQELFAELDAATPSHAVLAADTASMPITDIGELTDRADKVVGFHFAGPATKIRAVEVIEGEYTSPETVRAAVQFAALIRKTAVRCIESPGSVVARIKAAADAVPADDATMRRLVESCRVLEEGVASMKEIDGALAAAGVTPPPFAGADQSGLDDALARLELLAAAEDEHGELFEPPVTLRRLVAQGRLGRASGHGFYSYGNPDAGWESEPVKLESRGEVAVAWLDRPPANSISPEVIASLSKLWSAVSTDGSGVRALIIASSNPNLFCAGADIKAFRSMTSEDAARLVADMHAVLRSFERSPVITIAAIGGLALGGGCELAMACDLRVAADSASFGQPEIDLGLVPGFGGTQRLPRLVGAAKALEMNISGLPIGADEAYELGLANRLVPDHELFDTAVNLARGLARKARNAVQLIKQTGGHADLDAGIEAEKAAFVEAFASDDGREGVTAFVEKRPARFSR